jgi:uroporphyrinogen-III synthase
MPPAVLITRAQPAADETAQKLRGAGFTPIVLPIFEVKNLETEIPDVEFDAVIFTSANAAEILAARNWQAKPNSTAYCVGARTALEVEGLGFDTIITASGGGAALAKRMMREEITQPLKTWYPTTPDRSFDMAKALDPERFSVITTNIYQVQRLFPDKATIKDAMSHCINGALFIYSTKSGNHLHDILSQTVKPNITETVRVIGISDSAVKMMMDIPWSGVYVANEPSESAMLKILAQHSKP